MSSPVPQDLLTPTAPFRGESNGLIIRENPSLGFYVEGLREYSVRSHEEVCRGVDRMVLSHAHGLRFDGPASIKELPYIPHLHLLSPTSYFSTEVIGVSPSWCVLCAIIRLFRTSIFSCFGIFGRTSRGREGGKPHRSVSCAHHLLLRRFLGIESRQGFSRSFSRRPCSRISV